MQHEGSDLGVLGLILKPTPRTARLLKIANVPGSAYALEVAAFFDTNGRLPEPGVSEEKGLYRCLQMLRRCVGAPGGEALSAVLDGIPGLQGYPGCETEDRLEAIIRWSDTYGRVPSAYSDDPNERRLCRSWKLIRPQYETLSAEGREQFDLIQVRYRRRKSSGKRPGLSDPARRDPEMQLEKLKAWCAEHGHQPRSSKTLDQPDGRAEERRLALWMTHQVNPRHNPAQTPQRQHIREEILAIRAQYPAYRVHRAANEAESSARDRAELAALAEKLRGKEEGPAGRQALQSGS